MSLKSLRLSQRNIGYQCRIGSSSFLGEATLAMLMLMKNQVFMHIWAIVKSVQSEEVIGADE